MFQISPLLVQGIEEHKETAGGLLLLGDIILANDFSVVIFEGATEGDTGGGWGLKIIHGFSGIDDIVEILDRDLGDRFSRFEEGERGWFGGCTRGGLFRGRRRYRGCA